VGALILASLTEGFNVLNLGANYQYLVQGTVIIAAAAVYTVAGRRRRAATTAPEPPPGPAQPDPTHPDGEISGARAADEPVS
jgi:D-xylose transport system permease protein